MKIIRSLIYVVIGVAAAGGLWLALAEPPPQEVDILVSPELGPFEVVVTTTGELRAKNSIKIRGPRNVQATGIYQINISDMVPEGTLVKKGDFVAQLDKSDLSGKIKDLLINIQKAESQYEQARLDTALSLSQARDNLVNLRFALEEAKIRNEQSIYEAPSVIRQAQIDYERAERALQQAEKNYEVQVQQAMAQMREVGAELRSHQRTHDSYVETMEEFTVIAPADGMVIYSREHRGAKKGVNSVVSAWNPVVAELPDLSSMESVTYVNEIDIRNVRQGQPVTIKLYALPDKVLTGTVREVANVGEKQRNSDSKVFEVLIEVDQVDTTLRPAMTTGNEILVAAEDEALSVPLETIHARDSLVYVYKESPSGPVRQTVELGLMNGTHVVVKRGLGPDDRIYLSTPEEGEEAPLAQASPGE